MNRLARIAACAVLLAASLSAGRLVLPGDAFACVCAPHGPISEYAREPAIAIVTGSIRGVHSTASGAQAGTIEIDRVFTGLLPRLEMTITEPSGTCGAGLRDHAEVVLVGSISGNAIIAGGCRPIGDLARPEGRALLAEVEAAFKLAVPDDEDRASVPGVEIALAASIALALAIAGVMYAVIARRRAPR